MTTRRQRRLFFLCVGATGLLAGVSALDADESTSTDRAQGASVGATAPALVRMGPAGADLPTAGASWASDAAPPALHLPGTMMVRTVPGAGLEAVAAALGARVAAEAGPSGYAQLVLPRGRPLGAVLQEARSLPAVEAAGPIARVFGAGAAWKQVDASATGAEDDAAAGSTGEPAGSFHAWSGVTTDPCSMRTGGKLSRANPHQWHLDAVGAYPPDRISLETVTVAVLDTGVAYENHTDASGTYVQAPSLASVDIVAPWDFVNDDAHANDDHQHGTHIASIIASRGEVEGVAPGATLMPLKVLDETNAGHELDLVDALWHAVENGADIINMSLSFPAGYMGSPALREALDMAADAGVVVVAASGNAGLVGTSWPAAHPQVIAVTATGWLPPMAPGVGALADYANRSPRVDLSAPGGHLGEDLDEDGMLDGIVAETIDRSDPTRLGLWMLSGTSQAAAMVSGAAAYPVAAGRDAATTTYALQYTAEVDTGDSAHGQGAGSGLVGANDARWYGCSNQANSVDAGRVHATVLPVMVRSSEGEVAPMAQVQLTGPDGGPLAEYAVHATLRGTTAGALSCLSDADGRCQLRGPATAELDAAGAAVPLVWHVTIDAVIDQWFGQPYRPQPVLWASDALEHVVAATGGQGALALSWEDESDPILGELAAGYTVLAGGTGLSSSPLGIVFNQAAVQGVATIDTTAVDMDGTGLSSSPLGLLPLTRLTFDGSGLSSSPLGFSSLSMVALRGTGLSSSPLGLSWESLVLGTGDSMDDPMLELDGVRIDLESGILEGASAAPSHLSVMLDAGGWTASETGLDGASSLLGSGALDADFGDAVGASVAGLGAVEL